MVVHRWILPYEVLEEGQEYGALVSYASNPDGRRFLRLNLWIIELFMSWDTKKEKNNGTTTTDTPTNPS